MRQQLKIEKLLGFSLFHFFIISLFHFFTDKLKNRESQILAPTKGILSWEPDLVSHKRNPFVGAKYCPAQKESFRGSQICQFSLFHYFAISLFY